MVDRCAVIGWKSGHDNIKTKNQRKLATVHYLTNNKEILNDGIWFVNRKN